MTLQESLAQLIKQAFLTLYQTPLASVEFQSTRKDFEGDLTVVTFSMLRTVKMDPAQLGKDLGAYLSENSAEVVGYNVVKGFLNLVICDAYFIDFFQTLISSSKFGFIEPSGDQAVMVEYSSPNTNKPLHLGHVRNVLLGYSVAEILKASGMKVYKTQIINDRGIHICKSMLAWQRFGNNETPESTGLKGDKLVGNYYVKFDQVYKQEIIALQARGLSSDDAKSQAPIMLEAKEMLLKWEAGDAEVVALWKQMNQWVYNGFDVTYKTIGVDFDSYYYESQTYLLGKSFIAEGLQKGVFVKKEDGSVWCDLTPDGLDEKIVLRADGTAVYITQDIGTAIQRLEDFPDVGGMVYTVGNEQDYHFKVLFLILRKLGFDWANNLSHLSYGMVDLPSGKMKSREGKVVDADDLIDEMRATAKQISQELGKLEGYTDTDKEAIYSTIGLGALKYFILKVDPKKRILFDPQASVDFQGNTGPFIQYTYARIQAILRKSSPESQPEVPKSYVLHNKEKSLLKQLQLFPDVVQQAAANYSPALVANFSYDLVKEFNSFYQNVSILGADSAVEISFRVQLSKAVADTVKNAFSLLGIKVPERM
ncbi:arginine--tRNA ligase [Flavobacteriaceae bacterium]|nr:arginine--tRNA ligase [Flavobacteriaceae bacterium]MDC0462653.1 arginine--tRNA ligase [Flavobacteriaceae bacterium]MDC3351100.1 arginine--tRNA ligase [Flavobacteriaceae bacterium]